MIRNLPIIGSSVIVFLALIFGASYVFAQPEDRFDITVTKLDFSGDTIWSKLYDSGSRFDFVNSIQEVPGKGFIVEVSSYNLFYVDDCLSGIDIWLLMLDYEGDTLWSKVHATMEDDFLYSFFQLPDGGFLLAGESGDRTDRGKNWTYFFLKLDSLGDTVWVKEYRNLTKLDSLHFGRLEIKAHPQGGYCLYAHGGHEYKSLWVMRLDTLCDTLWTYSSTGGELQKIIDYAVAPNGNCLELTSSVDYDSQKSLKVYYFLSDIFGERCAMVRMINLLYEKRGDIEYSQVIAVQSEGYVLKGGLLRKRDTVSVLLKIDSVGNLIWKRRGRRSEIENLLHVSPKGEIITDGIRKIANHNAVVITKLDSEGRTLWRRVFKEEDRNLGYTEFKPAGNSCVLSIYSDPSKSCDRYHLVLGLNDRGNTIFKIRCSQYFHIDQIHYDTTDGCAVIVQKLQTMQGFDDLHFQ